VIPEEIVKIKVYDSVYHTFMFPAMRIKYMKHSLIILSEFLMNPTFYQLIVPFI